MEKFGIWIVKKKKITILFLTNENIKITSYPYKILDVPFGSLTSSSGTSSKFFHNMDEIENGLDAVNEWTSVSLTKERHCNKLYRCARPPSTDRPFRQWGARFEIRIMLWSPGGNQFDPACTRWTSVFPRPPYGAYVTC